MLTFDENELQWAESIFRKIDAKMEKTLPRTKGVIPYRVENGKFENMVKKNICWWTNGFWEGLLWLLYSRTGKQAYREAAQQGETLLDGAFRNYPRLHHDVGFLWQLSAGLDYKLTGNSESRLRALFAASILMSRFNLDGGYIRAWNDYPDDDTSGCSIIHTFINFTFFFGQPNHGAAARWAGVARAHADKSLHHHLRPDGSSKHIVVYDPQTGEELAERAGQGYACGSAWSRGQAWALYGFVISYHHTDKQEYLDAYKRAANFFIASVQEDWLPRCDFRSPEQPVVYDASAGAIAACGLLELATLLPVEEGRCYKQAALHLLREMEAHFCDWNPDSDGILHYGSINYKEPEGRNRYLVYSDFFFTQAITKMLGSDLEIW